MDHQIVAILMTLSDLQSNSFTAIFSKCDFSVQMCCSWHDFKWQSDSASYSTIQYIYVSSKARNRNETRQAYISVFARAVQSHR